MAPIECDESLTDDIEDIGVLGDLLTHGNDRTATKRQILPKVKKKRKKLESPDAAAAAPAADSAAAAPVEKSLIPGTQRVYVKTWGCAHNNSDGEYMAGQLAAFGYSIVDDKKEADLWLLNSCTVKTPAEDHFRNEILSARNSGKCVVVAGCIPQAQPKLQYIQGLSIIGVQQIDRVTEVVEETLKGHSVRLLNQKKSSGGRKAGGARLDLPKIRKNALIEIIAINTGCLNQCTYCKTKHARGDLGSYSPDEIVARAVAAFDEGVVEIWLTSEDTGAYGRDIGVSLPELLWKLVEVIPEGCMLRLGMTNPPYILEHLDEMAKILAHPRVYAFLHVPVQSGSDAVLTEMRREYCRADFERVARTLRDRVPGVTIATDVICGFPTETESDFEETLSLVEDFKFPSLFINQFFPRPGTPAAKMIRVDPQEVKRRTRSVSTLFNSYTTYDHRLGERQSVLVTELSHDKKHFVGHNKFYEQVLVPLEEGYLGKMILVDIYETGKHFLKGRPLPGQEKGGRKAVGRERFGLAAKISTADGDCCGDESCGGGGRGGSSCECGEGKSGCGEVNSACGSSAASCDNDSRVCETKEKKSSSQPETQRENHLPLWFRISFVFLVIAVCFRLVEWLA